MRGQVTRSIGAVALALGGAARAQSPRVQPAEWASSRAVDARAEVEPLVDPERPFVVRMIRGEPAALGAAGMALEARPSVASRAEALRAVVRLRDARGLVCTATLVQRGRTAGLLTAAHCLYAPTATGALGPLRPTLAADPFGRVDPARAEMAAGFRACAAEGRPWRDCADAGAPDVAFVPVEAVPEGVRPWLLCGEGRTTGRDVTVFGYGLNGRVLPRALLQGAFRLAGRDGERLRRAWGVSGAQIDAGDSGGPVISARDDQQMHGRLPCVAYVAAAVQVGGAESADSGSVAWLQPLTMFPGLPPSPAPSTRRPL